MHTLWKVPHAAVACADNVGSAPCKKRFIVAKGKLHKIIKAKASAFVTAYEPLEKFDATRKCPSFVFIMVVEPNAVKPCSKAILLTPSVKMPLVTTISGTQTGIQPRTAKTIQYMFSTTLSPKISSTAPNFELSFNNLATKPSRPSNQIAIIVKIKAVM